MLRLLFMRNNWPKLWKVICPKLWAIVCLSLRMVFCPNLRPAICPNLRPCKNLMEQVWLQRRITDTSGRKSLSCLADMGHLSLVSLLTWSIASRDFWLCYRDFELRQQEHDAAENWTFQNGPAKHSKSYSVRKQGDFANIISKVHLVDHFWNFLLQHISSRGTLRQSEFWPWLSGAAAPFRRFQVKIVWRIYEAPWWILVVVSKQNYVNIFFALWLVIWYTSLQCHWMRRKNSYAIDSK